MAEPEEESAVIAQDRSKDGSNPKFDGVEDQEQREELDEAAKEEARERARREREARAQALTLEIVGDLPYAEVKPPENVLFVCKLNPVTEGESKFYLSIMEMHGLINSRRGP